MIVFLTLCYVAVLFLLVKIKVIKLTLWWKISPAVWVLILLIALFIPMQWGAPAGTVNQYQAVVEIIPNVSGEVIEVPAKALTFMEKGEVLFKIDPRPFQDQVDEIVASLDLAKLNLDRAKDLFARKVGPQVDVDRFDSEVKQLTARLSQANYNLHETVVKAPGDGYVVGLTLRPGQRVANLPLRSWVAYVNQDQQRLMLGINQNMLRHVRSGQHAEVALKLFPGKVFSATVETIAFMTPQGQLPPSGTIPAAPTGQEIPLPYGVVLKLDDDLGELTEIPGGAIGSATIYTESAKISHIIRKVMLRMESWVNFINPY